MPCQSPPTALPAVEQIGPAAEPSDCCVDQKSADRWLPPSVVHQALLCSHWWRSMHTKHNINMQRIMSQENGKSNEDAVVLILAMSGMGMLFFWRLNDQLHIRHVQLQTQVASKTTESTCFPWAYMFAAPLSCFAWERWNKINFKFKPNSVWWQKWIYAVCKKRKNKTTPSALTSLGKPKPS